MTAPRRRVLSKRPVGLQFALAKLIDRPNCAVCPPVCPPVRLSVLVRTCGLFVWLWCTVWACSNSVCRLSNLFPHFLLCFWRQTGSRLCRINGLKQFRFFFLLVWPQNALARRTEWNGWQVIRMIASHFRMNYVDCVVFSPWDLVVPYMGNRMNLNGQGNT